MVSEKFLQEIRNSIHIKANSSYNYFLNHIFFPLSISPSCANRFQCMIRLLNLAKKSCIYVLSAYGEISLLYRLTSISLNFYSFTLHFYIDFCSRFKSRFKRAYIRVFMNYLTRIQNIYIYGQQYKLMRCKVSCFTQFR